MSASPMNVIDLVEFGDSKKTLLSTKSSRPALEPETIQPTLILSLPPVRARS
ncbi:hypothetical protein EV130_101211 [Rhizobium azibense]|uniref:Uncharacterized protein n=1 Tax=Rhizobium azibense TaxID=1136135 RepID=A0A4R3R678_9HYPH|nr:hypothetical protein EV130_101211 [Rhizobium azibense]